MRICPASGCGQLIPVDAVHCAAHAEQEQQRRRSKARTFGYDRSGRRGSSSRHIAASSKSIAPAPAPRTSTCCPSSRAATIKPRLTTVAPAVRAAPARSMRRAPTAGGRGKLEHESTGPIQHAARHPRASPRPSQAVLSGLERNQANRTSDPNRLHPAGFRVTKRMPPARIELAHAV
jgi:hypothetical protein